MTPKGAKACGLLALLARQPRMEHSRVWLQDKLWSDRGRDQAAASLRQALSQLRRDLGPAAGVLQITRTRVALDARRIRIADPDGAAPRAFLEGIDIRDPEFEDWLSVARASRPSVSTPTSAPVEEGVPGVLTLHLFGPFRVQSPQGRDMTPKGAKACGLLALLARQPRMEHSRVWLQDKLWSDRGRDQAAASLRQALSQLRRDLGPEAGVLLVTRTRVGLDARRVRIADPDGAARREFLEGIDIRDPEFEDWLRVERASQPHSGVQDRAGLTASPALRRTDLARPVHLLGLTRAPCAAMLFESLFIDCLERSIAETLLAEVYRDPPTVPTDRQVVVQVQAFRQGDAEFGIRIMVEEGRARRALWSGRRLVRSRGAPPVDDIDVRSLMNETTEAIADALTMGARRDGPVVEAAVLSRMAVRKIFSMSPAQLVAADALLDQAFALDPRAIFLAWKVQLRVIQQLERHAAAMTDDPRDLSELLQQALRMEPTNSMVLASAANALVLTEGDVGSGAELARRSLDINPANPFAWDCMSIALLMDGKDVEAHHHQLQACKLSVRSPIRHFWDMGACLTSVVTGDFATALRLAHSASVLVPDFRAPLRYMAALLAENGQIERAGEVLGRLKSMESDFTLDRMLGDPDYPVAAMRRAGLLERGRLRDLL